MSEEHVVTVDDGIATCSCGKSAEVKSGFGLAIWRVAHDRPAPLPLPPGAVFPWANFGSHSTIGKTPNAGGIGHMTRTLLGEDDKDDDGPEARTA